MENTTSVKETKFKSPVPTLKRIRNFLIGKRKPDIFTRITFWISLVIALVFLTWNVLGYFAINSAEWIHSEKGIDVQQIIDVRGLELGFKSGEFSDRLLTFNSIGAICWIIFIIGLFFLYRKRKTCLYIVFGSFVFYLGMIFFYIGFGYFVEDITFMDKVGLLIMFTILTFHSILMRNEKYGRKISFFEEDDQNDESDLIDE